MITGRMVFSSKLPCDAAIAIAWSSASTCTQTMSVASHWVGLTLPGMIELPGSLGGRTSSPSPHRGPEASQRMSLVIFISGTATPRSPADAPAIASSPPRAENLLSALRNGSPVQAAISAATASPNPGGAFSPVPTAVPPMASSYSPVTQSSSRSMAWVSWWA
jgi:hypothetical protein